MGAAHRCLGQGQGVRIGPTDPLSMAFPQASGTFRFRHGSPLGSARVSRSEAIHEGLRSIEICLIFRTAAVQLAEVVFLFWAPLPKETYPLRPCPLRRDDKAAPACAVWRAPCARLMSAMPLRAARKRTSLEVGVGPATDTIGRVCSGWSLPGPSLRVYSASIPWELPAGRAEVPICI